MDMLVHKHHRLGQTVSGFTLQSVCLGVLYLYVCARVWVFCFACVCVLVMLSALCVCVGGGRCPY